VVRTVIALFTLLTVVTTATSRATDEDPASSRMSVNDLMLTVVAPATDTLWGIEDPRSDAEWQVFIDAADAVIAAGAALRQGGAGPNDDEWATDPAWRTFVDQLVDAAKVAREAAGNKDLDGMYTAGEIIYTPCEECHIRFHPGVQGFE
jgi:hypothetical protein